MTTTRQLHNPGVRVTVIAEGPRYLVATRSWSVQLEEIQGEAGRFHAFSETRKQCPLCGAKFSRKTAVVCPRCRVVLEPLVYLIDCAGAPGGRPRCACESHTCNRRDEQGPDLSCCKHSSGALILFGHFTAVALAEAERQRKIRAEQASRATY